METDIEAARVEERERARVELEVAQKQYESELNAAVVPWQELQANAEREHAAKLEVVRLARDDDQRKAR
jgi:hypothetical protein